MSLKLSFLDEPLSKAESLQDESYDEIEKLTGNQITNFTLPMVPKTRDFLQGAFDNSRPGENPIKLLHGTTTLSFIYKGGIVVAVDSSYTRTIHRVSICTKSNRNQSIYVRNDGWRSRRLSVLGERVGKKNKTLSVKKQRENEYSSSFKNPREYYVLL